LPNVGKSTLFNALTKNKVSAENYPFCTIDPSVGVVSVPDARLEKLSVFSQSKKTVPSACEFVDIAGLVRGAAEGEGLGNTFLSHIESVDMIVHVVRIFLDKNIVHVHNAIDPLKDIETIHLELILKDIEALKKALIRIEKEVRAGTKGALEEKKILEILLTGLEEERLARDIVLSDDEKNLIIKHNLITMKPMLFALNKKAGGENLDETKDERWVALLKYFTDAGALFVIIDPQVENELNDIPEAEREIYRRELGAGEDGVMNLITKTYERLGLITFFTTGEDETRGWPIVRGAPAPEAGRAIHSDFKEKFIRAEVIHCDELLNAGSYAKAREKGLVRTEGKQYVVKNGDVIEFKI